MHLNNYNHLSMKSFILLSLISLSLSVQAGEMTVPEITSKISLMDIACSGTSVYFTCAVEEEEKQIRFFSYAESKWNEILLPADAKAGGFLNLKIHNAIPYILFNNNDGISLIKYENKTWHRVGKASFSKESMGQQNLDFHFKGNEPYVIFENSATKTVNIVSLSVNGNLQIWISPDAADAIPVDTEQPFMCLDNNESIYTVWFERKKEKVTVSKFNSDESALVDLSKGILSKNVSNLIGMQCFGNSLYLAFEDKTKSYAITIQRCDLATSKWEVMNTTENFSGEGFIMTAENQILFCNESKNIVLSNYANKTWSEVETVNDTNATLLRIASYNGNVYIAFLDSNKNDKLTIVKI